MTNQEIKWVKKEDFTPIDGNHYWAIIPAPSSSKGYFIPYPVVYVDGLYYDVIGDNNLVEKDNELISHVAEIVYPTLN